MKNFESLYYQTINGNCPVQAFIDSLSFKTQRKYFSKLEWLEEYGPRLIAPHAKKLEEDLYELRFEGEDGAVRIIYFFYAGKKIILVNGFIKKTQKAPRKEIELARRRKDDFLNTLSSCVIERGRK